MRKGFLTALALLSASSSLALAQPPAATTLPPQPIPSLPPSPPPGSYIGPPPPPPAPEEPPPETSPRFWFNAEYLVWWFKDAHVPPLLTIGSFNDAQPGELDQPGTIVIIGGTDVNSHVLSGGRFTAGAWLDDTQQIGLEGSYFFLGNHTVHTGAGASGLDGSALLVRPTLSGQTVAPQEIVVATPPFTMFFPTGFGSTTLDVSGPGSLQASLSSFMQGAEVNAVGNLIRVAGFRFDVLGGFRYLQLDETLDVRQDSILNLIFGGFDPATGIDSIESISALTQEDLYKTHNYFYGGQVGARAEFIRDGFSISVLSKLALGATHQVIDITSNSVTTTGGATIATSGDVIPAATSTSTFSPTPIHLRQDAFAIVPEVGIHAGYQLTDHLRASMGYTFIYWSNVVRPGEQVNQLGKTTDFWAQGIDFGLAFSY